MANSGMDGKFAEQRRVLEQKISGDEELIKQAQARIIQNRRLRNSLLPINRVPIELLSNIFIHRSSGFVEPIITDPDKNRGKVGWLSVTHVCSHWRNVALDTPSLWFSPDFGYPSLTFEMLKRSKQYPLYIEAAFHLLTEMGRRALKEALGHISHTGTLKLQFDDEDELNQALSTVVQPAPLLYRLSIVRGYFASGDGLIILPPAFLDNHAPNLTHLKLSNCYVSWGSSLFDSIPFLTCLDLSLHGEAPIPTCTQLLDILRKFPRLKKLQLRSVIPASDQMSTASISFPNLTFLSLRSSVSRCVNFLNYIRFPDTAAVELDCYCDSTSRMELDAELSRLRSSLGKILPVALEKGEKGIQQLDIGINDFDVEEHNFLLKAWTWDADAVPPMDCCLTGSHMWGLESPARLCLNLGWNQDAQHSTDDMVRAILPYLALRNLEQLHIKAKHKDQQISQDTASEFFASLPHLHFITMWGHVLPSFVQLLKHWVPKSFHDDSHSSGDNTLAFPALTRICVMNIDFEERPELWTSLFESFEYRKQQNADSTVETLLIVDCAISNEQTGLVGRALEGKWILDFQAIDDELDDSEREELEEDMDTDTDVAEA